MDISARDGLKNWAWPRRGRSSLTLPAGRAAIQLLPAPIDGERDGTGL